MERALRDGLELKGMGDKQVSHLDTKWLGLTTELVPLDSRWEDFLMEKGVFHENEDPSTPCWRIWSEHWKLR